MAEPIWRDPHETQYVPVTNQPADATAYLPVVPPDPEQVEAQQGPRVVKTELYRQWAGLSDELRSLHGVSLLGVVFAAMMLFIAPGHVLSWRSLWMVGGIVSFLVVAFLTRNAPGSTSSLARRRFASTFLVTVGFVAVVTGVMVAIINVMQHLLG